MSKVEVLSVTNPSPSLFSLVSWETEWFGVQISVRPYGQWSKLGLRRWLGKSNSISMQRRYYPSQRARVQISLDPLKVPALKVTGSGK